MMITPPVQGWRPVHPICSHSRAREAFHLGAESTHHVEKLAGREKGV
jgi:hypothetical protein